MLWIRTGFNADPDPAFYLNVDPDPDHQTFESQKVEFLHDKYTGKKVKNHTYEGTKAFLEGRQTGLFVNVDQFPSAWIRIRIPNTDPDPRQPKECGSRRIRIRVRIHNTGGKSDGS